MNSGGVAPQAAGIDELGQVMASGDLSLLSAIREGKRVALLVGIEADRGSHLPIRALLRVPDDEAWRQHLVDVIVQTWPDRAVSALEGEGADYPGLAEVRRFLTGITEGKLATVEAIREAARRVLDAQG